MLLLFETPAGYALFKVLNEDNPSKDEVVELKYFSKFDNTAEALEELTQLIDGTASKTLTKFLRAHCESESLAVSDPKLGNSIKEKLKIDCVHSNAVVELMRGIRSQLPELIPGLANQDLAQRRRWKMAAAEV